MSDDELFKSVLSSGKGYSMENNKNTTPKKRKLAPMIAAVAAATALATTAGAVIYNRSINTEYSDLLDVPEYFAQKYTDKDGNDLNMSDKAWESGLYEKLNIELDKTFVFEGYTLEIPGAISDGDEILIMYNLVFDEDPWSGADPWCEEGEKIYLTCIPESLGGAVSGHRLYMSNVSERDGKTVYSSFIDLRGLKWFNTDTLKISFDRLNTSFDSEVRYLDAEVEIPITDDFTKFNKAVDIPAPYAKFDSWGSWDIVQIEATPLGVIFNMKADGELPDQSVEPFSLDIPAYVTFKDGSTLDVAGLTSAYIDDENKTMMCKASFNYPVDVDEIQSVQLASALIDMNGSAAMVG